MPQFRTGGGGARNEELLMMMMDHVDIAGRGVDEDRIQKEFKSKPWT